MPNKSAIVHLVPLKHDADELNYDNSSSGLSATDVQSAIDEINVAAGADGTLKTIKNNGSQVGDSDIEALDFSSEFSTTESPDTEVNVGIAAVVASKITADDTNFNFFVSTDQQSFDEELDAFLFSIYPPAAVLDDIDIDSSGTTGKLSFGSSGSISGYTNVTGIGALSAVDVDGTFSNSGDRAGIFAATHSDITGTLNEDIASTANYPANAFRDTGQTLSLELNGTVVNTVDLSSTDAAINQGSSTSGFNVGAKTQGTDTPFFYRTGSWRIDSADSNLRNGWNYVRVFDDSGQSTNYVDWVRDADTTATAFSGEALDNYTNVATKQLSGVTYNTGGSITADYDITIDNAYRNTYSTSSSAVNHVGTNVSITDESLAAQSGDEAATVTITNKTATINASRIIDGSISVSTMQVFSPCWAK